MAVQNCGTFVDARNSPLERTLQWDFTIIQNPKACVLIHTGQAITWSSDSLEMHPLLAQGGDSPSPIPYVDQGTTVSVTFNTPGTFGFKCGMHSTMVGAIQVVQGPPAPAPAYSLWFACAFGALLLVTGAFVLQRRPPQVSA